MFVPVVVLELTWIVVTRILAPLPSFFLSFFLSLSLSLILFKCFFLCLCATRSDHAFLERERALHSTRARAHSPCSLSLSLSFSLSFSFSVFLSVEHAVSAPFWSVFQSAQSALSEAHERALARPAVFFSLSLSFSLSFSFCVFLSAGRSKRAFLERERAVHSTRAHARSPCCLSVSVSVFVSLSLSLSLL